MGAVAAALSASATMIAPAAHAAVYVSQLKYSGEGTGNYGTVTITELSADSLKVQVDFTNPNTVFVNTGGPHDPFVFNTLYVDKKTTPHAAPTDDPNAITIDAPVGKFYDAGRGSYSNTPFGTFTNQIAIKAGNGYVNGQQDPLIFTVYDPHGITFAGIGATVDPVTGKLLTTGTGDHFTSNTGGWWFSADIYDGVTKQTFNVAARDAFTNIQNAVPEPATWALMIMGVGGIGAALRRRRATAALA